MIRRHTYTRLIAIVFLLGIGSAVVLGTSWYVGRKQALTDQRSRASGGGPACDVTIDFAPPPDATPAPSAGTVDVTPAPTLPPNTPVCRQEVDVAIVIDRSGSMTDQVNGKAKIEWAKEAAVAFVNAIDANNVQVGISVVSFGSQGNDGTGTLATDRNSTLHIGKSTDYEAVKNAISGIRHVASGTCIQCGLRIGSNEVAASNKQKAVILLSDGGANHVWDGSRENAHQTAIDESNSGRARGIEYQVVGIGSYGENSTAATTLKSIAGNTANYVFRPDATEWAATFLSLVPKVCE